MSQDIKHYEQLRELYSPKKSSTKSNDVTPTEMPTDLLIYTNMPTDMPDPDVVVKPMET